MVIQSSNVEMGAKHSFTTLKIDSVNYTSWGNRMEKVPADTATTTPSAMDSEQNQTIGMNFSFSGMDVWNHVQGKGTAVENQLAVSSFEHELKDEEKVEYNSLKNLFQMMFLGEPKAQTMSASSLFQKLLQQYKERLEAFFLGTHVFGGGISPTQVFSETVTVTDFYAETEKSEFYSEGKVTTKDGKEISFSVTATMSRSFMSYASVNVDYQHVSMVDPLVISLDGKGAEVSDQKFLFDIDMDGELDNVSLLAKTCGFLALDRNGDGTINDGNELFGAKSGDGFLELAVFDLDGNGWIDEKDEVFNHLRIWRKDEDGNDKLVALGVAGIGAIYLGNIDTPFSLNSKESNEVNGAIRKSGVYLSEDGEAGLIQHVDLNKE